MVPGSGLETKGTCTTGAGAGAGAAPAPEKPLPSLPGDIGDIPDWGGTSAFGTFTSI